MKKFILLIVLLGGLTLQANAKYNFDLTQISAWGGDDGAGVTISAGTISYTTAWKGASLWPGADLTGYTHFYVRLASNCAFTLTAQSANSSGSETVSVGASTSEQVITLPIPGDKDHFGGFGFQAREAGSIAITEISAIKMTATLPNITYGDDVSVWPNAIGGGATAITTYAENTITMGAYENTSYWCGVQWWLAWNSSTESNSGQDYSYYDKIVVRFSEPVTAGKSGGVKVEYRKDVDTNEETNTYVDMGDGSTQVEVPLHPTLKAHMGVLTIQGPQNAVYKIESIKAVRNNTYYPLAANVATVWGAADGAQVDLTRKYDWNTSICLPFDVDDLSVFGHSAKAYEFTSASTTSITFTERSTIKAGVPYYMTFDMTGVDEADKTYTVSFNDVTIDTDFHNPAESGGLTFKGNYTPGFDMEGKYGVSVVQHGSNWDWGFYKGGTGSKLNAFSAYIEGTPSSAHLMVNLDEETTGVNEVTTTNFTNNTNFFDLQGRKVAQPTKGLYIVNGKKVIIK